MPREKIYTRRESLIKEAVPPPSRVVTAPLPDSSEEVERFLLQLPGEIQDYFKQAFDTEANQNHSHMPSCRTVAIALQDRVDFLVKFFIQEHLS